MRISKLKYHPLVFKWIQKSGKQFTVHLILHFFVYVALFYSIIHLFFAFRGNAASEEFQAYYHTLSYPLKTSQINQLENYMENSFLPAEEKGACAEALYKQYFYELDYENGLEQVSNAIYYYKQAGDSYSLALTQIKMAEVMVSMNAFEGAEKTIGDVLSIEISDENKADAVTYYSYITLADIYSRTNHASEALSALNTAREYMDIPEKLAPEYGYLEQVIKARCYLLQEDYESCYTLLSVLPDSLFSASNPFLSTHVSYLDAYSKLYLQTGNLDAALQKTKELTTYCEKHNYESLKLQHISDIISLCHDKQIDDIRIKSYEQVLSAEYPVLVQSCTELMAKFMAASFSSLSMRMSMLLYTRQLKWRILLITTLSLVIALVLLLIAKLSIDRSRLDALTGTYNRRHFDYTYDAALMNKIPFSLIIFDIDNFKSCNDTFGHEFGDEVLRRVSHTAKKSLFSNCKLFRYGGEEFCIVCPHMVLERACQQAELVRQNVEALSWEQDTSITISLGVADSPACEKPLTIADERLYYSKKHGKNRYTCC